LFSAVELQAVSDSGLFLSTKLSSESWSNLECSRRWHFSGGKDREAKQSLTTTFPHSQCKLAKQNLNPFGPLDHAPCVFTGRQALLLPDKSEIFQPFYMAAVAWV